MAEETKAERAERIRLKLMTSILTNLGYGVVAAGVIPPIVREGAVTGGALLGTALGLFFFATALYISPSGEPKGPA